MHWIQRRQFCLQRHWQTLTIRSDRIQVPRVINSLGEFYGGLPKEVQSELRKRQPRRYELISDGSRENG